jgi:hypothetical protein
MQVAGLQGEAAVMLGGFHMGRDQVPVKNFPRGAPALINMSDMMERQKRKKKKKKKKERTEEGT